MLIISYGTPPLDPVSWNRCKDQLKAHAAHVASPSIRLYLQHMKRFATDHVASLKLNKEGHADKKRGHFKAVYSAEALCWIRSSANHDPRQYRMLTTALADYKSKHLHKANSCGTVVSENLATTAPTTTRADAARLATCGSASRNNPGQQLVGLPVSPVDVSLAADARRVEARLAPARGPANEAGLTPCPGARARVSAAEASAWG